ncbi:MAG: hypothetical protein K6A05_00225 [Lachnospiraceae bacterium]|nr:hypothetical protein [Lachnospiraceae bacterium]
MSMAQLTVIQIIQIFAVYTLVMVFLPVFAFGNKMQRFSFPLRMMAYYAIGNFFVINAVLYLQLLHISYRPTLILATVAFYGFFMVRNRNLDVKAAFFFLLEMMDRRHNRRVGRKTFWRIMRKKTKALRQAVWEWIVEYVFGYIPEWVAAIGIVALIWYLFGGNYLENFGYGASDIPVHNYWINELSKENLFCSGIYPFGMHTEVYFLHQVFGFDTYVLLRLWGMINICCVCFAMLGFLGWLCKSKSFLPYLGVYLYLAPCFINSEIWNRFLSALPQEYGMIFILPAMAFLFAFFEERANGATEDEAKLNLFFFALNLALSISIHFYPAISILILCIGCGIAFVKTIFKKEYFFVILKTGLFAFALAVLPMMIAYVGGKPLQGSMGWALGVMKNGGSKDDNPSRYLIEEGKDYEGYSFVFAPDGTLVAILEPGETTEDLTPEEQAQVSGVDNRSFVQKVVDKIKSKAQPKIEWICNFPKSVKSETNLFILKSEYRDSDYGYVVLWLIIALIVVSVGLFVVIPTSGQITASIGIGYFFTMLMFCAGRLGFPVIMDARRGSFFFYYLIPVAIITVLDAGFLLLERWHRSTRISKEVAMVLSLSILCTTYIGGFIGTPNEVESLEYPGAITCLTNIVEGSKPFTYTIISANDELRMVEETGYHYEVISLLKHLALYQGGDYDDASRDDLSEVDKGHLYIPTEDIYVFIERIPLDYAGHYEGSGQRVSAEGAAKMLPSSNSLSVYTLENRWICMSKMYYWMQAFKKLHPDAVSLYYADSEFVCYRIHQNTFSLYDLCIDYGYNHCGEKSITVND